jgi:hemoglobin
MTTPEKRLRSAEERRAELQANASRIGVTEDYISTLVESFYARVRKDELLGPVFNNAIGENWPSHLAKLKDFWSSVALNTGRYDGRPMPVHMKLEGVGRTHFQVWLGLFEKTLQDTAPSAEAAQYFLIRAERIGQSLLLGIEQYSPAHNDPHGQ